MTIIRHEGQKISTVILGDHILQSRSHSVASQKKKKKKKFSPSIIHLINKNYNSKKILNKETK